MKPINFFNGSMLPKGLLIPLFSSFILFFISLTTSCNKHADNAKAQEGERNALMQGSDGATLVSDITINASNLGAIPNDGKDDTKAIQKAIDSVEAKGGGTVSLNDGDYDVNPDTSIWLKSNVTLAMTSNARLIAKASANERYSIIKIRNVHDARVLGGKIVGDRDIHLDSIGQWGYGINIGGSTNIRVVNTLISKCWGDGVIIAQVNGITSSNITIKGITSKYNRRQAISVINVNGLLIDSCHLFNTGGHKPEDGIDIEPDVTAGVVNIAENITITNCDIFSNMGDGIEINEQGDNIVRDVTIQNNKIHANAYSGYFQNANRVTFTNNWLWDNKNDSDTAHVVLCTNSVFKPNIYSAP